SPGTHPATHNSASAPALSGPSRPCVCDGRLEKKTGQNANATTPAAAAMASMSGHPRSDRGWARKGTTASSPAALQFTAPGLTTRLAPARATEADALNRTNPTTAG